MDFKDILEGKRISLIRTKPTIEMATLIFKTVNDNRKHLEAWFPWTNYTKRIEDSMQYLFSKEEETKQNKIIEYGIYLNNEYLGNISLFRINKTHKSAEIGYWLSKAKVNNGYMTEAVKIIEREAFENLQINRIVIKCAERNIASAKVAKKCNYRLEGIERENYYSEYFKCYLNTMQFSKLKSDYI